MICLTIDHNQRIDSLLPGLPYCFTWSVLSAEVQLVTSEEYSKGPLM